MISDFVRVSFFSRLCQSHHRKKKRTLQFCMMLAAKVATDISKVDDLLFCAIGSEKRAYIFKVLVISCLLLTSAIVGYGSYRVFDDMNKALLNQNFDSLVHELKISCDESLVVKDTSLETFATMMTNICPTKHHWPNCSMTFTSHQKLSYFLSTIASVRSFGMAPIITADQVSSFEAYARQYFIDQNLTNMGFSDIVYARNASGDKYHDTEGSALGEHAILTPVLQIGDIANNFPAVLFNVYSEIKRINAIDDVIDCYETTKFENCTAMTNIIYVVQDLNFGIIRPSNLLFHPIATQDGQLVGILSAVHSWDTFFSTTMSLADYGIDVVLRVDGTEDAYTYSLLDGNANYVGYGNLVSNGENELSTSFGVHIGGSVKYTVTVYATDGWQKRYLTNAPLYACVTSVTIILFTTIIFVLYNQAVDSTFTQKDLILQTKRAFMRYISHEIRTPMNIVHLGLKILFTEHEKLLCEDVIQQLPPDTIDKMKDWQELIADIEDSSDAAILVLTDLINYDKIALGQLELEIRPLNLWDLIDSTCAPFNVQAKQSKVRFSNDLEIRTSESPDRKLRLSRLVTLGDNIKLCQVVRNVVSNAIKFSPVGGQVTVKAVYKEKGLPNTPSPDTKYSPAGSIVLTVTDRGPGISKENQKYLFQEGKQFNANTLQAGKGSGLGLWIAKGVVELHHGTISIHSEGEGCGCAVTVEIPQVVLFAKELYREINADRFAHTNTVAKGSDFMKSEAIGRISNVLIVDDSALNRKMLSRLLRNAGYNCFEDENGMECVDRFRAYKEASSELKLPIDIILIDFEMPVLNGPLACKRLRELNVNIPIIGVTGNALKEDHEYFLQNGANNVLNKPITIDALETVFRESRFRANILHEQSPEYIV